MSKRLIISQIFVALCFFIIYFIKKDVIDFILGCVWVCIASEGYLKIKSDK